MVDSLRTTRLTAKQENTVSFIIDRESQLVIQNIIFIETTGQFKKEPEILISGIDSKYKISHLVDAYILDGDITLLATTKGYAVLD